MTKFKADKQNCTFWWTIHLNPNIPTNKTDTIAGYSKFENQDEAKDKEDCLMAKIEMLWKHNYIQNCTKIDIFKRAGKFPCTSDPLIITLTPNDYKLVNVSDSKWRIKQFLENFYDCIVKEKEVKFLRPLPNKTEQIDSDSIFNVNKHNFKTHRELYKFAEKQKSLGRSPGQVDDFVKKYTEEKLHSQNTNALFMQLAEKFNKKI